MVAGTLDDFGIYVHIPFCAARCDYCAFATWTDRDHLMAAYVEACVAELRAARADEGLPPATSVYVGGGTPSRLPAQLLAELLGAVVRTADAEVTVECNPEDATEALLATWRSAGATRVSFGVQSLVPAVLEGLGRRHDPAAAARAVARAGAAGFEAISVDLIFGGAGESDDDFRCSLDGVLDLEPSPGHISAYALTVEPGTPLAADRARHPDDDVQARRYVLADAVLSAAGYEWYEVSNWARPGHSCRHNRLYWQQGDYRGIGAAAHSHRRGRRWWNIRTPERYIAAVTAGMPTMAGEEVLSPQQVEFERLALALRTSTGVPASVVPIDVDLAALFERRGAQMVLTTEGRLLANEITTRLVPSESSEAPTILRP